MNYWRFTVIGDKGSGKTTFCSRIAYGRYLTGPYFDDYSCDISDSYRKDVDVDGKTFTVELIKVSPHEELVYLLDSCLRCAQGFFLTYSITDRTSFEVIDLMVEEILKVKDEDSVPMVLIGTKCDAEDKRQVMKEEGLEVAEKYGIQFFETSAETGVNITEALEALILLCEGDSVPNINDNNEKKHKHKKEKCLVQ